MEFKIKKDEFLKALRWGQSVVERKTTMPILSNILLETTNKALRLTATDLETTVVVETEADILKPGRLVVSARNLFEIVRELPQEEVKITGARDHFIDLRSGTSKFKVVGMNPDEFPQIPSTKEKMFNIEADVLKEMIDKTLYAVSTSETRQSLGGVYFENRGDKNSFRMVATDGHRLSYVDRQLKDEVRIPKGVILPRKGVVEIKKLLEEGAGPLALGVEPKQVIMNRGPVTLYSRLVDGTFPDYNQVIPKTLGRVLSIDKSQLEGALKRTSLVSLDRARGVSFAVSPGNLELSSSHPDFGEAREELSADYKGESFKIGFNARYVIDILAVLKDDKVTLEMKDEVSPCVIRSEFDKGFLSLIMPMRL